MGYKYLYFLFLLVLLMNVQGCTTWHTLEFETKAQPIQFGPLITPLDVDTLGLVSGIYTQYYEEEIYSENEHIGLSIDGEEYWEESLSYSVYKALNDHPDHYIAESFVEIRVERGITFWAVIKNFILSAITGAESEGGDYTYESIRFNGVVYIPNKVHNIE